MIATQAPIETSYREANVAAVTELHERLARVAAGGGEAARAYLPMGDENFFDPSGTQPR